jgi:hypothetical protein
MTGRPPKWTSRYWGNPELHRAKARLAYERIKADPERYARWLERNRLNAKKRRDAELEAERDVEEAP